MRQQKAPIDYQLEYMEHLFFSIKHKKTESYVIHRIWDKLDDMRIRFVVQQKVELPNGRYALADLYLPQIGIFVEINEPFHAFQKKEDDYRNENIIKLTQNDQFIISCGNPNKDGEWLSLNEIHQQIDQCVTFIKERINQIQDLKPWDMSKWLSVEYHKQKGVFKAEDNDQLRTIDDICAVFNTKPKYHGYLRVGTAAVPNKEKLEIWYPNIHNRSGWSNHLSEDQDTFVEFNEKDEIKRKKHVDTCIEDNKLRITFFRHKDELGMEFYKFIGIFALDIEESKKQNKCIWRRKSREYKL